MGAGEQNVFVVRADPRTGGLSLAGRHAAGGAGLGVHQINLVKRVVRFAFALEDQRLAIRREVAFTAPFAFEDELVDLDQKLRFATRRPQPPWNRQQNDGGKCQARQARMPFHTATVLRVRIIGFMILWLVLCALGGPPSAFLSPQARGRPRCSPRRPLLWP